MNHVCFLFFLAGAVPQKSTNLMYNIEHCSQQTPVYCSVNIMLHKLPILTCLFSYCAALKTPCAFCPFHLQGTIKIKLLKGCKAARNKNSILALLFFVSKIKQTCGVKYISLFQHMCISFFSLSNLLGISLTYKPVKIYYYI